MRMTAIATDSELWYNDHMGKLHKLRRAIEREPDKWKNARAAKHWRGNPALRHRPSRSASWEPQGYYYGGVHSYRAFIKHVLKTSKG